MKYYSTQRPVTPGSYPTAGAVSIENYPDKRYCEDIDREAWGHIIYDRELTEQEVSDYELTPARTSRKELAAVITAALPLLETLYEAVHAECWEDDGGTVYAVVEFAETEPVYIPLSNCTVAQAVKRILDELDNFTIREARKSCR